jgi:hypothetical protein
LTTTRTAQIIVALIAVFMGCSLLSLGPNRNLGLVQHFPFE